jgi:hypothetical protein
MRTTIRRDHIVDLVIGNRRPFAVDLDLVMVADHAALRRAAVHEITAGAFAVVSVELQVKVFMPPIVADPEISFLRRCAYTKRHEERAAKQHDELAARHSITSSASARIVEEVSRLRRIKVDDKVEFCRLLGMRQRMVINALPAHMAELGIVAAQGREGTVPATGLRVGVGRRHQVHAMTN